MASWTFVFEGNDDQELVGGTIENTPIKIEQASKKSLLAKTPEPLKATRSQPTPCIPQPTNSTNTSKNTGSSTKWNFTGTRLKPHVVGVHFDKHSQYLGNWQGGGSPSSKKIEAKATAAAVAAAATVPTRPKRQIKRSLKKLSSNRTSAPNNYNTKSCKAERRRSSSQYATKTLHSSSANAQQPAVLMRQNSDIPISHSSHELPNLEEYRQEVSYRNDFSNARFQGYTAQHIMNSSHQQFSNSPNLAQAPEPLYRSFSLPHPGNSYNGHNMGGQYQQQGNNELLELLEFSLPESRQMPQRRGSTSENRSSSNRPSGLQRHSSLMESYSNPSNSFDFGELQYSAEEETRIQPTHVYFNEETSFQNLATPQYSEQYPEQYPIIQRSPEETNDASYSDSIMQHSFYSGYPPPPNAPQQQYRGQPQHDHQPALQIPDQFSQYQQSFNRSPTEHPM